MIWLLSAFKPNVLINIQAWLLLKHTRHTLGASLSTDVSKCLIGYHQYLRLLASHRLDPCEILNLRSVCSQQLHGNMGPCRTEYTLEGTLVKGHKQAAFHVSFIEIPVLEHRVVSQQYNGTQYTSPNSGMQIHKT